MARSEDAVLRKRDRAGHSSGLRELEDDSETTVIDGGSEHAHTSEGKISLSSRINGTAIPTKDESIGDEDEGDFEATERQSQRKSAMAILMIFIGSLVVMALLFHNFPELDE